VSQPTDATDETQLLRAKVDRLAAQLAEEYRMASIGRLLAGIVHEINSPIGSILSNNQVTLRSLELLKTALDNGDPASMEKARRIADTCRSLAEIDKIACERISEVVRGLKTFVRPENAEFRKVNLNEQLRDTLKLTHGEFKNRIAVETVFGELPPVECHASMLNQVFLNILVNAGQAIEGPGTITIRTEREAKRVHVAISDTGPGIRPEDWPKIFTSGFTTKPVGMGTGLGLSISKKIVEHTHGGSLSFESQLGAGTTFHIRIPIEQGGHAAD